MRRRWSWVWIILIRYPGPGRNRAVALEKMLQRWITSLQDIVDHLARFCSVNDTAGD